MQEFKKGDRVIWDSGFGYEIGYYMAIYRDMYIIEYASGNAYHKNGALPKSEIYPYSNELVKRLTKKYGYEKKFSEVF